MKVPKNLSVMFLSPASFRFLKEFSLHQFSCFFVLLGNEILFFPPLVCDFRCCIVEISCVLNYGV